MANGKSISVDRVVYALTIVCNGRCFTGDYLVGPIPYNILRLDWLERHGKRGASQLTRYMLVRTGDGVSVQRSVRQVHPR